MQYPIFISIAETSKILRMGPTAIYQRISDGDFTTAKIGRSTRITFASAIKFAMRCLKEGNGSGALREIFGDECDLESWVVAEKFAQQLCYTHTKPTEVPGNNTDRTPSPDFPTSGPGSTEKNSAGDL